MIKADLYNYEGKKKESINLPREYDLKPNMSLLTQSIRVYEDGLHLGLARVKTRGEVQISTRKIYRQKGTGGARHGAKSAPIFVGGGVAHGPKGIKRKLNLLQSQRKAALLNAINFKTRNSTLVVVDGLVKIEKAKAAQNLINKIRSDRDWKENSKIVIALSVDNLKTKRAFRNLENIKTEYFNNLNAFKILNAKAVIIDKNVFDSRKEDKVAKEKVVKKQVKTSRKTDISEKGKVKKNNGSKSNKASQIRKK